MRNHVWRQLRGMLGHPVSCACHAWQRPRCAIACAEESRSGRARRFLLPQVHPRARLSGSCTHGVAEVPFLHPTCVSSAGGAPFAAPGVRNNGFVGRTRGACGAAAAARPIPFHTRVIAQGVRSLHPMCRRHPVSALYVCHTHGEQAIHCIHARLWLMCASHGRGLPISQPHVRHCARRRVLAFDAPQTCRFCSQRAPGAWETFNASRPSHVATVSLRAHGEEVYRNGRGSLVSFGRMRHSASHPVFALDVPQACRFCTRCA